MSSFVRFTSTNDDYYVLPIGAIGLEKNLVTSGSLYHVILISSITKIPVSKDTFDVIFDYITEYENVLS